MLRECRVHGYFRGTECPVCGESGRFLMNDRELNRVGRTLAGTLRHFPDKFALNMDEHGWVDLERFVRSLRRRSPRLRWLKPHHIQGIIETDPKGRYQYRNGKIRATYGHSIDVDLDLPTNNIPPTLYYPATEEEIDILLETGLKPSDRKMVHLSKTYEDAEIAGKHRVDNPQIIEVNAKKCIEDGVVIQRAAPTVFLVKEVPPEYLSRAEKPTSD